MEERRLTITWDFSVTYGRIKNDKIKPELRKNGSYVEKYFFLVGNESMSPDLV